MQSKLTLTAKGGPWSFTTNLHNIIRTSHQTRIDKTYPFCRKKSRYFDKTRHFPIEFKVDFATQFIRTGDPFVQSTDWNILRIYSLRFLFYFWTTHKCENNPKFT